MQSEQDKHQEMEGPPHFAYKFLREHANASSHNGEIGVYWYLFSNHYTRKCIHKK